MEHSRRRTAAHLALVSGKKRGGGEHLTFVSATFRDIPTVARSVPVSTGTRLSRWDGSVVHYRLLLLWQRSMVRASRLRHHVMMILKSVELRTDVAQYNDLVQSCHCTASVSSSCRRIAVADTIISGARTFTSCGVRTTAEQREVDFLNFLATVYQSKN
jgi:hypothetical protein